MAKTKRSEKRGFYVEDATRKGVTFSKPSRTRQEFSAECDINTIMARYQKTGLIGHMARSAPRYLDVTEVPDLQSALHTLHDATDAFMRLPAVVRREFDNDPVQFVEYATKPENLGQLREWGLAEPEKAPEPPMRVEVVNRDPDPVVKP